MLGLTAILPQGRQHRQEERGERGGEGEGQQGGFGQQLKGGLQQRGMKQQLQAVKSSVDQIFADAAQALIVLELLSKADLQV